MENFETRVLGMLTLMDADSLACAWGLVVRAKERQPQIYLKYILRQFNSEHIEGGDVRGSSWYTKLHDPLQ